MSVSENVRGLSGFDERYYKYFHWTWLRWAKFFVRVLVDFVVPLRLWPFGARRVLELGCGKGDLVLMLRLFGVRAYGLDSSPAAATNWGRLRRRFCVVADGLAPPFAVGAFDIVVSQDFLEHLYPWQVPQAFAVADSLCRCQMLHSVTTSEDTPWIDLDATHHTKRPGSWWRRAFERLGWQITAPTQRRRRAGYFLLERVCKS